MQIRKAKVSLKNSGHFISKFKRCWLLRNISRKVIERYFGVGFVEDGCRDFSASACFKNRGHLLNFYKATRHKEKKQEQNILS